MTEGTGASETPVPQPLTTFEYRVLCADGRPSSSGYVKREDAERGCWEVNEYDTITAQEWGIDAESEFSIWPEQCYTCDGGRGHHVEFRAVVRGPWTPLGQPPEPVPDPSANAPYQKETEGQ